MMPAEKPNTKMGENRRSNKPIMEKRRRARINSCLNDLKALILEALKKDPARHSKLEKADILEMTVRHLQNLQRQQMALAVVSDSNVSNKFRAGFNECANEVTHFLNRMEGLDPMVRQRLVSHLSSCVGGLSAVTTTLNHTIPLTIQQQQVPCAAAAAPQMTMDGVRQVDLTGQATGASVIATTPEVGGVPRLMNGLQLVPTRLPNGDLALLLPGSYTLATGSANTASANVGLVAGRIPAVQSLAAIVSTAVTACPSNDSPVSPQLATGGAAAAPAVVHISPGFRPHESVGVVVVDAAAEVAPSERVAPPLHHRKFQNVAPPPPETTPTGRHVTQRPYLERDCGSHVDCRMAVDPNDDDVRVISSSSYDVAQKHILIDKEPWRPW